MRIGIFSDTHANIEALEAVQQALTDEGVDKRVCLGDTVGYGASPNECLDLIRNCSGGKIDLDPIVGGSLFTGRLTVRETARALYARGVDHGKFVVTTPGHIQVIDLDAGVTRNADRKKVDAIWAVVS